VEGHDQKNFFWRFVPGGYPSFSQFVLAPLGASSRGRLGGNVRLAFPEVDPKTDADPVRMEGDGVG